MYVCADRGLFAIWHKSPGLQWSVFNPAVDRQMTLNDPVVKKGWRPDEHHVMGWRHRVTKRSYFLPGAGSSLGKGTLESGWFGLQISKTVMRELLFFMTRWSSSWLETAHGHFQNDRKREEGVGGCQWMNLFSNGFYNLETFETTVKWKQWSRSAHLKLVIKCTKTL